MRKTFINTEISYIYPMSTWILQPTTQKIIESIVSNNEISEKSIKKSIKVKENEIRKILYKLEELGIVAPIGAFTLKEGKLDFKWKVKITDIKKVYEIIINKEIAEIDTELENMPDTIYYCLECGISYDTDSAYENNFQCKECGSILVEKENYKKLQLKELKEKLIDILNSIKKPEKTREKIKTTK
ncbi:hypothetical protein BA065_02945 [Nanoarchaeota archaeon NZ13-N]|uniref:Transcription factor E n=1 Tax=Candidatus Nanoclepta minutus TaxID=1940235 RepID=A0A397WQA7_9ARCH|nr:MAG: hypothetical protein BA065_02945 [Nanoarchaeota archaeon NZ13-N]RIB35273.1 MAG: hypothetical protein BXU00_01945 [Candidatus Nanoclepta minutus]